MTEIRGPDNAPGKKTAPKSENTKSRRTAVRAGCAIALTGVCAGLVPGAVQAEEKKLLIGIVELQLTNPFFSKNPPSTRQRRMGSTS